VQRSPLLRSASFGSVLAALALPATAETLPTLTDPVTGSELVLGSPSDASAAGDYLAGLVAGTRQDLAAAARFLLAVQASDPDNPQLLTLTFLTAAAVGLHEDAARLAPAVLALEPENASALLVLTADAALAADWAAAAGYATTLPTIGVSGAARALLLAWITLGQGDLAKAQQALAPLAAVEGLRVLHHLHRALLADVAGDAAAAQQDYEEALASADQRSLRLSYLIGNFYSRFGKPDRAAMLYRLFLSEGAGAGVIEQALQQAEAQQGEAASAPPAPLVADVAGGLAEVLFQLASIVAQEQAEDPALIQVNLALRLKPGFDAAQVLLGEVLHRQGRYAEAIAAYGAVPAASLHYWNAGLNMAEELYELERVDEAIALYHDLAAQRPAEFQPYYLLGNLLRAEQRFAEAAVAYESAVERLGEVPRRYWTLLYYRGISYERSGAWDKAEPDLLRTLELEPDQPQVLNYLAYSWVEMQKNLEQAKTMLLRAVELRPNDGYIVDSLGWALYRLGDYEGAVASLERAVELEPAEAVVNDHLGDAYWKVGRKREARVQWERVISLLPSEEVDEATVRAKIERGLVEEKAQD